MNENYVLIILGVMTVKVRRMKKKE